MLNLIFVEPKDMPRKQKLAFIEQGVKMANWSYMIIVNENVSDVEDIFLPERKLCPDEIAKCFYTTNYNLEQLLNGSYPNLWFKVKVPFLKKKCFVGIAYHA